MKEKMIIKNQICELTDSDKIHLDLKIGETARYLEECEEKVKQLKNELDIAGKKKELKEMCETYKNGYWFKDVECYQKLENGYVITRRSDTHQEIEERVATEDDLQHDLFKLKEVK